MHHAEGHGEGDRNRDCHQQGRSPLPKADERDDDHQDNGFFQRAHEQVEILLYLQRLVGGADDHQVVRQVIADGGEFFVNALAELCDLLPFAHLHGESHRAAAMPLAVFILQGDVVQVARRTFVHARNFHEVAQVDRAVRCILCSAHDDITNSSRAFELAGGIESYVLAVHFQHTTWYGAV